MSQDMNNKSTQDIVNDAFKSATFADKVWLMLSKYRKIIKYISVVFVVLLICSVSVVFLNNYQQASMQRAYLSIDSDDSKCTFAKKYCSYTLGACVAVQLADDAYQKENYIDAEKWYTCAVNGSENVDILHAKSIFGQAMSLIKQGKYTDGESKLMYISEKKHYSKSIRFYAKLLLAQSYISRKDVDLAKDCLNKLIHDHTYDFYKSEAEQLLHAIN